MKQGRHYKINFISVSAQCSDCPWMHHHGGLSQVILVLNGIITNTWSSVFVYDGEIRDFYCSLVSVWMKSKGCKNILPILLLHLPAAGLTHSVRTAYFRLLKVFASSFFRHKWIWLTSVLSGLWRRQWDEGVDVVVWNSGEKSSTNQTAWGRKQEKWLCLHPTTNEEDLKRRCGD